MEHQGIYWCTGWPVIQQKDQQIQYKGKKFPWCLIAHTACQIWLVGWLGLCGRTWSTSSLQTFLYHDPPFIWRGDNERLIVLCIDWCIKHFQNYQKYCNWMYDVVIHTMSTLWGVNYVWCLVEYGSLWVKFPRSFFYHSLPLLPQITGANPD